MCMTLRKLSIPNVICQNRREMVNPSQQVYSVTEDGKFKSHVILESPRSSELAASVPVDISPKQACGLLFPQSSPPMR